MKIFVIFVNALSFAMGMNWDKIRETCGQSNENRIIGGKAAKLGQFPWIAHIGIFNSENGTASLRYVCSGSLVHPRFIISAAHCAVDLPSHGKIVTVKLGEHNLETKIDCEGSRCADPPQIIYPKRIIVPKEYDSDTVKHDIAVIELNEPVNITKFVSPICLPMGELLRDDLMNKTVEVAGWGISNMSDLTFKIPILQTVRLPILDMKKCKDLVPSWKISKGNQICAGGVVGEDSCFEDSGGPLIRSSLYGDYGPRYVLFGIVSLGIRGCAEYPGIYTNVSHYMPWIMEIIEGQ